MEDKCICCGADVSDLSTQVCVSCVNRAESLLNQNKVKMSKVERYYRECWKRLLQRHKRRKNFNFKNSQNETNRIKVRFYTKFCTKFKR